MRRKQTEARALLAAHRGILPGVQAWVICELRAWARLIFTRKSLGPHSTFYSLSLTVEVLSKWWSAFRLAWLCTQLRFAAQGLCQNFARNFVWRGDAIRKLRILIC